MTACDYTWKIGIESSSRRELRTNKPVAEGAVLIDLFDGRRYLVQSIYPAKPTDREWSFLPETVIQTWPVGLLSTADLGALRTKAGYTQNELCGPLGDVVFFPKVA